MHIRQWFSMALLLGAATILAVSLLSGNRHRDVEGAAQELGQKIERRMALLDKYVNQALHTPRQEWMDLKDLPEDMVVYRYVEDTLQSWANQFPIRSDDIRPQTLVNRLGDSRGNFSSPLKDASEELQTQI